jgi:hypothetical protein
MVDMYVTAVKYDWMDFETVPDHWKPAVAEALGIEYPATEEAPTA